MATVKVDRQEEARKLVAQGKVYELVGWDGAHVVTNGNGRAYLVTADGCTCPDWEYRGSKYGGECKHVLACQVAQEKPEADGQAPNADGWEPYLGGHSVCPDCDTEGSLEAKAVGNYLALRCQACGR